MVLHILLGHFTFSISLFAEQKHYIYSQAARSKLSSSQIYYLLLLYFRTKEWRRLISLQTS